MKADILFSCSRYLFFSSIVYPELFSSCSQQQLSRFLDQFNPACLLDSPSTDRIFGGPVCGNAFLEPGEECDCGSVEVCACSPNARSHNQNPKKETGLYNLHISVCLTGVQESLLQRHQLQTQGRSPVCRRRVLPRLPSM